MSKSNVERCPTAKITVERCPTAKLPWAAAAAVIAVGQLQACSQLALLPDSPYFFHRRFPINHGFHATRSTQNK
jgi:hypothetical protein